MTIQKIELCHNKQNSLIDFSCGISIIDILISLGFIWVFISKRHFIDTVSISSTSAIWEVKQIELNALLLIYIVMRIIQNGFKTNYLVIIGLFVSFLVISYELMEGIKQIIEDLIFSYPISIHGSYLNSGPYGGALSLCLCSLLPYTFYVLSKRGLRIVVWVIVSICLIMILISLSRSAWLAAGFCFVVMYISKKPMEKKRMIAVLTYTILFGGYAYFIKKESADGRFLMNKIAITAIKKNSLWGAGLGRYCGSFAEASYDYYKVGEGEATIEYLPIISHENLRNIAGAPFDAFNEYLRVGVELGVPGLIILLVLSGLSLYILFSINSIIRYGLLSLLIFAFFSYPFSLPLFQVYFVFFIAIASTYSKKIINGKCALVLGIFLLITLGVTNIQSYPNYVNIKKSEKKWKEYDELYDLGMFGTLNDYFFLIHRNLLHNSDFIYKYGKSLQKEQRYSESSLLFFQGATISSDPIFWNELGNNYACEGLYNQAEKCYLRAFYILPNRLYPLYYLCKLYYLKGDINNFIHLGNMVIQFSPKVHSNTIDFLKEDVRRLLINVKAENQCN